MATYYFDREKEALRKEIVGDKAKGPTIKAPPAFGVKADDGTVIPVPYEFLGDSATIVVATPNHLSIGSNKTYIVQISNRKGSFIAKKLKEFGVKQATQQSILRGITALFGASAGQAAAKPLGFVVGMLVADDLGNTDANYYSAEGKTSDGKTVYFFLTGDRVN